MKHLRRLQNLAFLAIMITWIVVSICKMKARPELMKAGVYIDHQLPIIHNYQKLLDGSNEEQEDMKSNFDFLEGIGLLSARLVAQLKAIYTPTQMPASIS